MRILLTLILSCCFLVSAQGETAKSVQKYPQKRLTVPAFKVNKIFLKGYKGQVRFVEKPESSSFKIDYKMTEETDDWNIQAVVKGDKTLMVEILGPEQRQEWPVVTYLPTDIVITGPARPLEVHWKSGEVDLSGWNGNIFANLQSVKARIVGGKGDVNLSTHDGHITLMSREGDVDVESYAANVVVDKVNGKINVDNYSGKTELSNLQGQIQLAAHRGLTKIFDSQGKLNFKNGISQLKIDSFEGEVRGDSEQGAVTARLRGEVNVRIRSVDGPVDIRTRNSGARVNLGTKEGNFNVAPYLKLTRYSTMKVMSGRLRGDKKGYVFIRTESGPIRVR